MPLDEFGRIRQWTGNRQSADWLTGQGVIVGIGDDAAVVEPLPPGEGENSAWRQLLTVDTMVETVHFLESTMTEADIGYKALAANVSDIAAMGGIPRHALISVSAPSTWGPERVQRLYDGLYSCATEHGVAVVGGDTTSSPLHLVVSVTLTGAVERDAAITRSGAQPGDAVFVTGPLGLSAAGLHYLLAEAERRELPELDKGDASQRGTAQRETSEMPAPYAHVSDGETKRSGDPGRGAVPLAAAEAAGTAALVRAHRRPQPSVQAGRWLAQRGTCTALNDVSDGLASEAWELAEASDVALVLQEELLPRAGSLSTYAARVGEDPLSWMLYGGEDYALVGTMASSDAEAAKAELNRLGIPFYVIGRVVSGDGGEPSVVLETSAASGTVRRSPVPRRGYNHFATSIHEERTDRHDS